MSPPRGASWASHSLTVAIVAHNAAETLAATLETALRALSVSVEEYEVLLVDAGSTDGSGALADALAAENPAVRVLRAPTEPGAALRAALAAAEKSSFIAVPGDNTWPRGSLQSLFGELGKADVIAAFVSNLDAYPSTHRRLARAGVLARNLLFGLKLRDYSGLAIYPTEFLRAQPHVADPVATLLRAIHAGLSFIEVSCTVEPAAGTERASISPGAVAEAVAGTARQLVELRLRARRGPRSTLGLRRSPAPRSSAGGPATLRKPARPLNVLVAGASSGIGAALVRALAADGHTVFACARRADRLHEATHEDTLARSLVCDVTSEADVARLMAWIGEQTPALDALIDCAGTFGAIGPLGGTDSAAWLDTFRVNLHGPYLLTKHAVPLLERSDDPRVLYFSGNGALSPFPNYTAFASAKAAVIRLAECTAAELAPRGIAVNVVAPGLLPTEAHQGTLEAGPARAGALYFQRIQAVLRGQGGASMESVVACVRTLLAPETRGLTGKTISAAFDPWQTSTFVERLADITRSDLWTMRRVNIVNLPKGSLRTVLSEAWANKDARR